MNCCLVDACSKMLYWLISPYVLKTSFSLSDKKSKCCTDPSLFCFLRVCTRLFHLVSFFLLLPVAVYCRCHCPFYSFFCVLTFFFFFVFHFFSADHLLAPFS